MKLFSTPGEKLHSFLLSGDFKKADKLIRQKGDECLRPFLGDHYDEYPLTGALKGPNIEENLQVLKHLTSITPDFHVNEGVFSNFFYEFWKPANDAQKIDIDLTVLKIAHQHFGEHIFYEQLFEDSNIPFKNVNLEKVRFVLNMILEDVEHQKSNASFYFLKALCLLLEYKPQILRSTLKKYETDTENALKKHSHSDEAKVITQFIATVENI